TNRSVSIDRNRSHKPIQQIETPAKQEARQESSDETSTDDTRRALQVQFRPIFFADNRNAMNIRELLTTKVQQAMLACGIPADLPASIAPGKKVGFGDYQANCAMGGAKSMGTTPRELAAKIVAQLQ